MSKVQLTPEPQSVFNEFDRQGLLLILPRLKTETNILYKQRLFDVFVHRADSTYKGLINGITRELGLNIVETLQVSPVVDGNGDTLLPMPAIVFLNTKCLLYKNFTTKELLLSIDRFEVDGGSFGLGQLVNTINATGYFTATLLSDSDSQKRSMTIFNQSSIKRVPFEDITNKGVEIHLENANLVPDSVTIRSNNVTRQVFAQIDLRRSGDYLIDLPNGIIFTVGAPAPGSSITYEFRDDEFKVESSPVIIHNLQSDDFRTKMFTQVTNDIGETYNGLPTNLGSDIINELLSVFPSNWGT